MTFDTSTIWALIGIGVLTVVFVVGWILEDIRLSRQIQETQVNIDRMVHEMNVRRRKHLSLVKYGVSEDTSSQHPLFQSQELEEK